MEIPDDPAVRLRQTIRLLLPDGQVAALPIEEYLRGVVPWEMPATAPPAALRAQSVAARCYAVNQTKHREQGADICTTTHCQVWRPESHPLTDQAIAETASVVATVGGRIINALFFAHCDGRTRDPTEVWAIPPVPYLKPVPCPRPFPERYGHGVGLCQEGAIQMARDGADYVTILQHYYMGVAVVRAAPASEPTPPEPETSARLVAGPLPAGEAAALHAALPAEMADHFVVEGGTAGWMVAATEHFQSIRALAGNLGEFGIEVTVADSDGNSVTVHSGLAPAYGEGGWEVRTWREGAFTVTIEGQAFAVAGSGALTVLTFQRTAATATLRSRPRPATEARAWLATLAARFPDRFRLESA